MSKSNGIMKLLRNQASNITMLVGFGYILVRACIETFEIAWGTGLWLGEFSLKWGVGFFVFTALCSSLWIAAAYTLWKQPASEKWWGGLLSVREKLGPLRWLVVALLLVFPVWFLQYTPWGIVFSGLYFRLILWIGVALGLAVLMHRGERLLEVSSLLVAILLTTSAFTIAAALTHVSSYPFSLGWSEGNRMWDYSMMFGRHLYDYPPDQEVYVLLDIGRQFIGGVPFLFPNVSIWAERLWVGLTTIFPYLLLGFASFRSDFKDKRLWILLTLWTFIFLKQGPIHPPLVICAVLVALLWRSPLWVGVPLIFATGYFAEESRFTWLFAPGIWIVMLEFSGAEADDGHLGKTVWWRAGVLGLFGALGGYYGATLLKWGQALLAGGEPVSLGGGGAVSISTVTSSVSVQPLLWYRLLPNATYGMGILLALLVAITPTVGVMVYLALTKKWSLNSWQKLAIISPLLAFLGVGLIVSTKIGGGGDLHNMDMFLIGIFFTAVIAWNNGGRQWLREIDVSPAWVQGVMILLLVIPGIQPLSALRSFRFAENLPWLVTLTDVSQGKFLELLPPQEEVDDILGTIRREVETRKSQGEILFMDQRQLLTFGYVENVPFVPEYEKKILMNQAMGGSASYFKKFYGDLAAQRFSLIISEPLRAPVKDSSYQFGEENNAWVQWVVEPVLCYYEPIETYRSAQIQLLVPNRNDVDCSSQLPISLEQ